MFRGKSIGVGSANELEVRKMGPQFDRAAEDLGNIVALEHVNVTVPDQQLATLFYVVGLGLTRDPYLMTSVSNMWVNIGRSQFHLPTSKPQVVRGRVGVVLPDRESLVKRLTRLRKRLDGTRFDFEEHDSFIEATCPWGNRIRCYSPDQQNGAMSLGIAYVEFNVPAGNADGISRFYRRIMKPAAAVTEEGHCPYAPGCGGTRTNFLFCRN